MSKTRKTLFELAPDTFIIPGRTKNGAEPLADLVFQKDPVVPGLYRAKLEPADLGLPNGDSLEVKERERR